MGQEIGVAVIGFGLAGQVFHAPFVSAVPGLRLEVIVQRKGDEAAKAYPSARILRTVDEALRDPAIQMVVVGNSERDALRAGEDGLFKRASMSSSTSPLRRRVKKRLS